MNPQTSRSSVSHSDDSGSRCAVLIVNYFSHARVKDLLSDLANDPDAKSMVVSVLDNSVDAEEAESLRLDVKDCEGGFASAVVSISTDNLGYAGGNNRAFTAATMRAEFDVVVVVNPDLRIAAGSVLPLIEIARDEPGTIVVPESIHRSGIRDGRGAIHLITSRSRQLLVSDSVDERKWLTYPGGHFFAINRERWEWLNGLSEDFFLYGEEADLMLRASQAGMTVRSSEDLRVDHETGGTTGSSNGRKSAVTMYNASRSAVLLFRKHASLRRHLPTVVAFRLVHSIKCLLRGQGSHALKGTFAGLSTRRFHKGQAR